MQAHQRFLHIKDDFRDPFSRDKDRIIHSPSFRRLEHKTQVFINSRGDYYRTRLTHSLEVSQISRSIARHLGLDEHLSEAIALSHDIGHTPFGHIGGDELDRVLKKNGFKNGFEHNFQSFRVVHKLENMYANHDGLNLTFATLDGILKHSYPHNINAIKNKINTNFNLDFYPCLEAIIADISDEIAYISHDIDDGLKSNIINIDDINQSKMISKITKDIKQNNISQNHSTFRYAITSSIIKYLVYSLLKDINNKESLKSHKTNTFHIKDGMPISFNEKIKDEIKEIKEIMHTKIYKHDSVITKMSFGKLCIRSLFDDFINDIDLLPKQYKDIIQSKKRPKHRVISDFIAGMSDRFCTNMYQKLHIG